MKMGGKLEWLNIVML